MAEGKEKTEAKKKSWFEGLKSEFNKIVWPERDDIVKQTTAVVAVSVVVGIVIAVIDTILKYGIDYLVALG